MTRLKHQKKSTKEKESDMKTNDTLCVGGSIEYVVPSHACFLSILEIEKVNFHYYFMQ